MTVHFRYSATAVAARAAAAVLMPPAPMRPTQWARDNLVVPDGPRAGEPWSLDLTPYVAEPLDFMGPDSPVNEIAIRKGVQTGFTTLAIAMIGHSIDRDPCRMMVIQPTDGALSDFNREKLQPAIEGSKALAAKVAAQTSRSATGSTTYSKRFPGGSLTLAIASSPADLRSKTIKKMVRDEIDEYPDDLDGQGSPLKLSEGRLTSFLAQGDWKLIDISTPTVKGASKIDERFEEGDQRFWRVPCPHCTQENGKPSEFTFEWGENFRFSREYPHNAHYVAPCCGSVIEAHEKASLVRKGRWAPTVEEPGRFPSYHFDALSSPFVPWDHVAKEWIDAGEDPTKLKAFWNLWLGLAYEIKGDAPDHELLYARREDGLVRGQVPPGGLMLVGAADVQMRGIWWEVKALGLRRESWVVDAGYLDGDTSSPTGSAFEALRDQVLNRDWPDAWNRKRALDAFGIDSGYQSHAVYGWVRSVQRLNRAGRDVVYAVKGADGWGRPAIGSPALVDIRLDGRKIKKGCKLWTIGTWPLKGAFYEDLRKQRTDTGTPEGFHHFGAWLDMAFFRQITAEYLTDEMLRGKPRRVWKIRASERDNHWLDTEVYIAALAEHLGVQRMTSDEWAVLMAERGPPPGDPAPLFAPPSSPSVPPAVSREASAPDAGQAEPGPAIQPAGPRPAPERTGWSGAGRGWLKRNR
jgi:hypothetical protein